MRLALVAVTFGVAAAAAFGIAATTLLAHDPISTKITWEGEIKRLVEARCVSCHSDGGRAPMALTTYEEARPWARAIREEVLTRRMPKWPVVRGYGDFSNDPSLSPFEVALFAAWADGGAPRTLPPKPGAPTAPTVAGSSRFADPVSRPVEHPTGKELEVDVPCTARSFPAGRVVGLRPVLGKGDDLRVTMTGSDGSSEPLLWLRNFDPAFAETYWLRRPLQVTRASRVEIKGDAPCRVTVLLAPQTAR